MASNDAQTTPRRRTAQDGRIVTNVGDVFGAYICDEAKEMGISPATMARILINEAITKHRGISKETLEAKYRVAEEPVAAAV